MSGDESRPVERQDVDNLRSLVGRSGSLNALLRLYWHSLSPLCPFHSLTLLLLLALGPFSVLMLTK
jgi:hypothetical protein